MNNNLNAISLYRANARRKILLTALSLIILLLIIAVWRISKGDWDIEFVRVLHLLSPWLDEAERFSPEALVIRSVRLPRLFAAVATGGLLSISGAVLQGLLSNPLAEPYTLGIAAGAAFGGAIGLLFGTSSFIVTPAAFIGAMASLACVGFIAWRSRGGSSQLVLAGIVANAVLSAGVTFLKAIADDKLGAIVLWLMGGFSGANFNSALAVWGALLLVLIFAFAYAPMLDAMSLGQERGAALGIDETKIRVILLIVTSLGIAAAVSSFGIIGFVGLVIPHLLRIFTGPAHRPLLLLSCLAGGVLLAGADGAAQNLGELPVGVLTALIGGPFFCWLLIRRGRN